MKKQKLIFSMLILITLSAFQGVSFASDLNVGATAWYTGWDYTDDNSSDVKYSPTILYGPVLSYSLSSDLGLSFVFLFGSFDMDTGSSTQYLRRYDSDLTLNYRLNNYFKFFAGAKFLGFSWPDGNHLAAGPGAGFSSVLPVGGNFFILGNISGMYLRGKEDGTKGVTYNVQANEFAYNGSLSLAYYITAASTTISLGGRYQQANIYYTGENSPYYADSISKFYGVTLTAIYTFSL